MAATLLLPAACCLACCVWLQLLRLLLGGNACVARRGDWWERLAINLEHQGLAEQALEVGGRPLLGRAVVAGAAASLYNDALGEFKRRAGCLSRHVSEASSTCSTRRTAQALEVRGYVRDVGQGKEHCVYGRCLQDRQGPLQHALSQQARVGTKKLAGGGEGGGAEAAWMEGRGRVSMRFFGGVLVGTRQ
jgi:hypothetical protein